MAEEPLNREQRRAARFRPHAGRADPHAVGGGGAVDIEPGAPDDGTAPVGAADEPASDDAAASDAAAAGGQAVTGGGGSDVTHRAGAGTGGATESSGRMPHHEGTHYGNRPNG